MTFLGMHTWNTEMYIIQKSNYFEWTNTFLFLFSLGPYLEGGVQNYSLCLGIAPDGILGITCGARDYSHVSHMQVSTLPIILSLCTGWCLENITLEKDLLKSRKHFNAYSFYHPGFALLTIDLCDDVLNKLQLILILWVFNS